MGAAALSLTVAFEVFGHELSSMRLVLFAFFVAWVPGQRVATAALSATDVADREGTICDRCTLFAWHPSKVREPPQGAGRFPVKVVSR